MGINGPRTDVGRDLAVFVDPQADDSLGTAAATFPSAADAVRVIAASINGKSPVNFREDRFGENYKHDGTIALKRTGTGSIEAYLQTSGTAGVAPDIDDLLTKGGWTKLTGTTGSILGAGATTTVLPVQVGEGAGFSVGGAVIVGGEIRRITGIATDDLTVAPPLSAAPANATAVTAGVSYYANKTRDCAQDSMTCWAFNNKSADRGIGWVPDSFGFTLGGDAAARITAEGPCRRVDRLLATRLNGGVNAAVLTFTVDLGLAAPSDLVTHFQVDDEIVSVDSVSGSVWTVTRAALGSVAATHLDNALIFPYQPDGTFAGSPLPATSGEIILSGSGINLGMQLQSAAIDCDMGINQREDEHGDGFKFQGYTLTTRTVATSMEGWTFFDQEMTFGQLARQRVSIALFVQQGDTLGDIIGVSTPGGFLEEPDLSRGDDEVTISFALEATATPGTDLSEIFLLFG